MSEKIENTEQLTYAFANMQSTTDLLDLLNMAKRHLFGERAIPFSLKQFNYFTITRTKYAQYTLKHIPKKTGGTRTIHAPVKGLKHMQACMNLVLQVLFQPNTSAMGFIPGKSIVDNAKAHVGKGYVLNIDLKDFFPSVERSRVWACLLHPPFNLGNNEERRQLANRIAVLCTVPMEFSTEDGSSIEKIVLPQGAPTSPTITNIVAQRLDRRLQGVAKRYHLTYTRYADDITFSSNKDMFTSEGEMMKEVRRIITEQNFTINEKKLRKQQQGYRQEVTGLVVNEKVNVPRKYIRELRQWLYLWERYGYDKAYCYFLEHYVNNRGYVKSPSPDMACVLGGKLDYLKMVKGEQDSTFKKLNERYLVLRHMHNQSTKTKDKVAITLEKLVAVGLEEAMNFYLKHS